MVIRKTIIKTEKANGKYGSVNPNPVRTVWVALVLAYSIAHSIPIHAICSANPNIRLCILGLAPLLSGLILLHPLFYSDVPIL